MHDFMPGEPPADRHLENHPQLMIGKVASLYDITVQTLRHYDKIGLFRPEVINPDTGYRYYSLGQLRQLEYILFLRRLQFSLPEIQEAMDEFRAGGTLADILNRRDAQIEDQIARLRDMQNSIRGILAIQEKQPKPENAIGIRKFGPPRKYLLREIRPLSDAHPDFPLKLMEHRKKLLGAIPSIQTDYSFGATVSLSDFRESGVLRYTGVLLDPGLYGSAPPIGTMEMPEGFYATIRFSRNEMKPEDAYTRLSDFLRDHHFRTDDTILECGLDPSFASISRVSELTELQVRIYME